MDTNVVNIRSVSIYDVRMYQAAFEAQFMKRLSNTEAKLKKSVDYKKA